MPGSARKSMFIDWITSLDIISTGNFQYIMLIKLQWYILVQPEHVNLIFPMHHAGAAHARPEDAWSEVCELHGCLRSWETSWLCTGKSMLHCCVDNQLTSNIFNPIPAASCHNPLRGRDIKHWKRGQHKCEDWDPCKTIFIKWYFGSLIRGACSVCISARPLVVICHQLFETFYNEQKMLQGWALLETCCPRYVVKVGVYFIYR